MLLVLNLPLVGIWVQLLRVPRPQLYAGILVFALIGVWGISGSWVDLVVMFVIGLMGYVMRVYDFPIAPVLIGLILGPMAEVQLRTALAAGQGNPLALVSTPLSATLMVLAVLFLGLPPLLRRLRANA
jgi:putative tricarboxylic transport membrane protein